MKQLRCAAFAALLILFALPADLLAVGEGAQWFQINNRLRVEYDDNVNLTPENEQDSYKIIEELELFLNFNLDQSFISLRYRPSYVYWTDREPDDTDFNHDIDFVLNHEFTPRLSLSVKDTFRIAELPELIDRGTTFRENNDFKYNQANGTLAFLFAPQTRAEFGVTYDLLRYDESTIADVSDYDIYTFGADLRHQVVPETEVSGQLRYETTKYDANDRDADTVQIGGAVDQTFSPALLGNARLGWEHKEFDDGTIDNSDQPFIDGRLTYLPSPATRLSAGGGFSQSETDVAPFANQDRLRLFASVAHDWTARVQWFLSTTYILNQLDAAEAVSGAATPVDGSENIFQLSSKLTYRLNRSNTLEAGWQLVNLDSDVRDDYLRNRLNLGWKTEL